MNAARVIEHAKEKVEAGDLGQQIGKLRGDEELIERPGEGHGKNTTPASQPGCAHRFDLGDHFIGG